MNDRLIKDYMHKMIILAREGMEDGELPVGACVVAMRGEMVSSSKNATKSQKNSLAHAEYCALQSAFISGNHRLPENSTLITTLFPCMMCIGASILSGVRRIIYACESDTKYLNLVIQYAFFHGILIQKGPLENDSKMLIVEFFEKKRSEKK